MTMSVLSSIVRRQLGLEKSSYYDVALQRLKCYSDDVYRGVTPNPDSRDFSAEPPICASQFCPVNGYEHFLALANDDGNIALQDTTQKGRPHEQLQGFGAHRNAIFDLAWMPNELKLVTTSGDHSARLWDVSTSDFKLIQTFLGHTRSVKNVVFRTDDNAVFATGARDGVIMIWDIRANHSTNAKPDNSIMNAHATGSGTSKGRKSFTPASRTQSITGLAFQDDSSLISCSAADGLIKVWDLRKNYTVHKKDPVAKHILKYTGGSVLNGFTSLKICPSRVKLYASCQDNTIYTYNISSYNPEPTAEYFGYENKSFFVKICLSPDGKYLLSGSSDTYAYLWRTSKHGSPLVRLTGHAAEVTCIDWCSVGETKIVTCSDDGCHRIWRVGYENREDDQRHDLHGQAEAVPASAIFMQRTPTTRKRRLSNHDKTPSSINGRGTSEDRVLSCDSSQENKPSNSQKRNYTEMSSATGSKIVLSPILENCESTAKRIHLETRGARRLFSPDNKNTDLKLEPDEPAPSTSRQADICEMPFSPTSNLPNFVIDGTAPHLNESSPRKYKENLDWLTKIRKEKEQRAKGSAEKTSPKAQVTPARRSSRSKSTELRRTPRSPAGPLLNFFRSSTNKECERTIQNKDDTTPVKKMRKQ
ncbi:protein lethal(2)denticleless [Leptopilina heterotoma]|uniref:protein lethal(2)denticleless n=1 Tax=Leptopilina heterotoma TaxID=63436 RepID=UPI001CA949BE|nr:protein lethal(2)denticleless [Leptopilina heterotoma]